MTGSRSGGSGGFDSPSSFFSSSFDSAFSSSGFASSFSSSSSSSFSFCSGFGSSPSPSFFSSLTSSPFSSPSFFGRLVVFVLGRFVLGLAVLLLLVAGLLFGLLLVVLLPRLLVLLPLLLVPLDALERPLDPLELLVAEDRVDRPGIDAEGGLDVGVGGDHQVLDGPLGAGAEDGAPAAEEAGIRRLDGDGRHARADDLGPVLGVGVDRVADVERAVLGPVVAGGRVEPEDAPGVDQAGRQGQARHVDPLGALGDLDLVGRPDGLDLAVADQDGALDLAGLGLRQDRAADDRQGRRSGLILRDGRRDRDRA